jgi:hypothetical protein
LAGTGVAIYWFVVKIVVVKVFVEVVVVLIVRLPDTPTPTRYPAPELARMATISKEAIATLLMPQRVVSWGVKFYS